MELNNIKSIGNWGEAANDLNQNFNKINSEVEKVKNVTTRNKGYFSSDDALNAAFPTANVGDIAYVGESYPYQTWAWDGTEWKKKNDAGGEESVNLGNYYTKEEADAKLSELGQYVENPGYARAYTDAEGRFLWGIRKDGSIEWAKGIPTPVKKYIESLDLENDEEIERINQLVIGLTDTFHYISNPEWTCAIVDSEGRVLFGIKNDGTCYIPKGISEDAKEVLAELAHRMSLFEEQDNAEFVHLVTDSDNKILMGIRKDGTYYVPNRESYHIISNTEWIKAVVDSDNKILMGIRKDGTTYIGKAKFIDSINIVEKFMDYFSSIDNPEWLEITTDNSDRILEGVKHDGKRYFAKQEMLEKYDDKEGRTELTVDSFGRILSYRDSAGVKHEIAGFESPKIDTEVLNTKSLRLNGKELENIEIEQKLYTAPNVPKYGYTNIKTETFYLTYDSRVNSMDDVYLIQDVEDTTENAQNRMTLYHYYVKSTLTDNGNGTYSINENSVRLRLYAADKVKEEDGTYKAKETIRKVDGVYYYGDTLGYTGTSRRIVLDGYSEVVKNSDGYTDNITQIKVNVSGPFTAPVCVGAWTVEDWDYNAVEGTDIGEKYEHYCVADVDFGHYLKKTNAPIGVKHQGNSTQAYRKRNLRYTFYKDNTYDKKEKIKIGEMVRLSGYNLKAGWVDKSRVKELVLYRLFIEIWNNRPIIDRYDWDNKVNGLYHGATGTIQCFPIRVNVAGDFYGIYVFGLKKDEKNYMLDGSEESGIFVSGAHNTSNDWATDNPDDEYIKYHYDLEMQDEWFRSDLDAMRDWHNFINGRLYVDSSGNTVDSSDEDANLVEFEKENIPERLDVLGFMDYFICMQAFVMYDNSHNNMAVYFGKDKKKFHPFFYDLDGAIQSSGKYTYDCDILAEGISLSKDMSLWQNIHDIYWDEIVNRYCELRKTVLSMKYIRSVFEDIVDNIPPSDFDLERNKWGSNVGLSVFEDKLSFLEKRFDYLDNNYFIV